MKSKLYGIAAAALLAGSVTAAGPAIAQASGGGQSSQSGNASGGQSSQMEQRGDNTDWGWIGLLGLIGLAGLRGRRRDVDVDRNPDTTAASRAGYNR